MGLLENLGQLVDGLLGAAVITVTVGRLHQHHVGAIEEGRVLHQWRTGITQIAGEHQTGDVFAFGYFQFQKGRAENMPGVAVAHAHARFGLKKFVVAGRPQLAGDGLGVFHRVQRLHGAAVAVAGAFAVGPFRFHFLDVGAVFEHDGEQVHGRLGAVDRAGELFLDHARQKAAVIDMGVGEQNEVELGSLVKPGVDVSFFDFRVALVQAAIDGETGLFGFYDVTGAGNGLGGPHELDFHQKTPHS